MAHDLLAALGARIEAQLKARHSRSRTLEDTVKARVSLNTPAPFALLADDSQHLTYLPPTKDVPSSSPVLISPEGQDPVVTIPVNERFPSAEEISAALAPFAAVLTNTAQFLADSGAAVATPQTASPRVDGAMPVSVIPPDLLATDAASATVSAPPAADTKVTSAAPDRTIVTPKPIEVKVAPAVAAATGAVVAPIPTAATTPGSTEAASAAATARILPPGAQVLPDGTIIANLVPNKMPAVPPEFGLGATVRRKGVHSDVPMTVTVDYNGIIRATVTDAAGTRTFESPWDQFEIVTRAPGT